MSLVFACIGIAAVIILALNASRLGERLGVMDDPKSEHHKKHVHATPLVGAILISAALLALLADNFINDRTPHMLFIAGGTICIAGLGFLDDRHKLSWEVRLFSFWLMMAILLLFVPELRLADLRWSWGMTTTLGTVGGSLFTALCLVGLVIALNMMDGFNGSVLSQCLVWSLIFAFFATDSGPSTYLYLAGVVATILVFNLKGKLFLGDGGAYALGFLMGCSAILAYNANPGVLYADTIVVWLALPVFDCLRVIYKRKREGKSPFLPQRDHLHHLLMNKGGQPLAQAFTASFALVFGTASLFVAHMSFLIVLIQLLTITIVGLAVTRPSHINAAAE